MKRGILLSGLPHPQHWWASGSDIERTIASDTCKLLGTLQDGVHAWHMTQTKLSIRTDPPSRTAPLNSHTLATSTAERKLRAPEPTEVPKLRQLD